MNKVFNDKVQASFGIFFQQIDKLLHCKSMTSQGENLGDLMIFQSLWCIVHLMPKKLAIGRKVLVC